MTDRPRRMFSGRAGLTHHARVVMHRSGPTTVPREKASHTHRTCSSSIFQNNRSARRVHNRLSNPLGLGGA